VTRFLSDIPDDQLIQVRAGDLRSLIENEKALAEIVIDREREFPIYERENGLAEVFELSKVRAGLTRDEPA
jgi:hypothetical protein